MNSIFIYKATVIFFLIFFATLGSYNTAQAASAAVIDVKVDEALDRFYKEVSSGKELMQKAQGVLVFPSVIKAGFAVGGQYGEEALRINGKTVDYYSTAAASFGFQLGAQSKTIILLFMTKKALTDFRKSQGWEVGVDGSVALVTVGVGGSIDTTSIQQPIIGFIMGQKGLMYNLTLEGAKMTKINK